MEMWTEVDQEMARMEGWLLVFSFFSMRLEIQKDDSQQAFQSDRSALVFVILGSMEHHRKARWIVHNQAVNLFPEIQVEILAQMKERLDKQ